MYKDIVIVSAVRTPFGRYCGSLREYDYFELGALPMKEVLARVNVPGDQVDEVFWGVGDTSVCKDVYTPVAARQTLIKAELPPETPSVAIDKACVSAMSAVHLGCRAKADVGCHFLTCPVPDGFVRVEVRTVGRQGHDPQSQVGGCQILDSPEKR